MPKVSKSNRAYDKTWRELILAKEPRCAVCGKTDGRLNAHHLIPKEFKEFRWDMSNGMTLCVHHHTLGKFSAHKNPVWFFRWLDKYRRSTLDLIEYRIRSHREGLTGM